MCPNGKKLEYISGSSRYDVKTHKMLDRFLQTGKLNVTFAQIGKYSKNICYMNETRPRVTAECCKRFIEENNCNAMKIDFKSDNKKEVYDVAIGMPIIATQNIKNQGIYNTIEFKIEETVGDKLKVNGFWFERKEFRKKFIPSFCVTVYKYQGCDIDEHHNIFDVNRMDKKQLYTALSRTTHLVFSDLLEMENVFPSFS